MIGAVILFLLSASSALPDGFVYLSHVDSSILQDIRYFSEHNFIGSRIMGYEIPECVVTKQAADALSRIQQDLLPKNLSLKMWDCYRPQMAVDMFVLWANNSDSLMKQEFYPTLDKSDLFPDYIAKRSGHSRGSTVDLTLVHLPAPHTEQYHRGDKLRSCFSTDRFVDGGLDMGTGFDCCDPLAHTDAEGITETQRMNRRLLVDAMENNGWRNYAGEWWHYTLSEEPFPDQFFNFPIA